MTARKILLAVLLLAAALAQPAAAEAPITVRGGLHKDYVRMVFDWPKTVKYSARIEVGRLVVVFPPGHSFDFKPARGILRKHLQLPDGVIADRRLAFPLLGDFELRHFTSGPRVVIDLVRRKPAAAEAEAKPAAPTKTEAAPKPAPKAEAKPDPKPTPKAAPDTAAKPAPKGPQLRVRVGRHPGYGRLVFDWPQKVGYSVTTEAGRSTIRFDKAATIDLNRLKRSLPPQVRDLEIEFAADSLAVTLIIPPSAKVRHFTSGPKVAVDVLHDGKAEAKAAPKKAPKPAAKPAAKTAKAAAPTSLLPPKQAAKAGKTETAVKAAPAQTAEAKDGAVTENHGALGEVTTKRRSEGQVRPAPGPQAAAAPEISLRLPWARGAKAAAFRRGANIWLAFSRAAPPIVRERIAPEFGPLQRIDQQGATLLYFEAPSGFEPFLRRDDQGWVVDIRRRSADPLAPLKARLSDDLQSLLVRLNAAGPVLDVEDPSLGDRLFVVPVAKPGLGSGVQRSFPEFRILTSFQGLVIQSLSDSLKVSRGPREILLTGRGALAQAGGKVGLVADAQGPERVSLLELAEWRGPMNRDFNELRQELQAAVVKSPPREVAIARLRLARFLFARGFASEALSLLEAVVRDRKDLAKDPQVALMRAAGQFLRGDYQGAGKQLEDPGLAGEWEAQMWRAALAARAQDWEAAASGFSGTEEMIAAYPRAVRSQLRLLAAEAALESDNTETADELLAVLGKDRPSVLQTERIRFLRGLRAALAGDAARARRSWEPVAEGPDRPSRARAKLALVDLALAEGEMEPKDAIEALERLRFAWRGDFFEFTLLERLAGLYEGQKDYRKALRTLRQAASHLPDFHRSDAVALKMREIFHDLYFGERAEQISPLTAVSLYEEFRELTPVGPKGEELITRLADRLVQVDLLDEAAELLKEQVEARLSGLQKAKVGSRLALIRLFDRKPDLALEALDTSKRAELPEALARERRHLRAKALSGLDRGDEALKILAGDSSEAALRLRAEIQTRLGRWAGVAETLGRLLPAQLAEDEAVRAGQRGTLLSLAVALTLAGDNTGLQSLDGRYGTALAGTAEGETFKLLVDAGAAAGQAPIAEVLARAEHAEAFLTAYRQRLTGGQLSQLN